MNEYSIQLHYTTNNKLFNKTTIEVKYQYKSSETYRRLCPLPHRKDDTAAIFVHSISVILSEHDFKRTV